VDATLRFGDGCFVGGVTEQRIRLNLPQAHEGGSRYQRAGVVDVEVIAGSQSGPRLFKYTWANHPDDRPSIVTDELAPTPDGGTTFVFDHTEFKGIGGFFMSKLLARVRRKMLSKGLPLVLNDLTEVGTLRPDSLLRPKASH
jgi:uncharacterized protein YndB with AHSA1/START domain